MTTFPSGTVTFLFTDIEGSTERWERDQAVMGLVVERHHTLMRTAIETHHGVLFKRVGDAVQAAFPTALMPLPQPSMPNGHWQRVAGPRWVAHSPSAWRCTLPPLSRVTRTTSLLDSIALPAWCPLLTCSGPPHTGDAKPG